MERFTHLGRSLDLRLPSNLVAILATAAAAAAAVALGRGVSGIVNAAIGTYLAWMLGREIDPDRPMTANVSAASAGALLLGSGSTAALGALYLVTTAARITIRSTGKSPMTTDLLLHLGIAVWVSIGPFGWVSAMALAVAIVLDARWDEEDAPPSRMALGAATGVVSLVAAGLFGGPDGWANPEPWWWAVVAAGAIGGTLILRPEAVYSVGDYTGEPLDPDRLRSARTLVLASLALTTLVGGADGLAGVSPGWIVLAVAGLFRVVAERTPGPLAP